MIKGKRFTKTPNGVSVTHEATDEILECPEVCPEVCEEECVNAEMLSEQEKGPVVGLDDGHNYIKFEEYMELEKEIDHLNSDIADLKSINKRLETELRIMGDRAFELERQKKNAEDRYIKLLGGYTEYRNNAIRTYNRCQQAWRQLDCELGDLGKDLESEY